MKRVIVLTGLLLLGCSGLAIGGPAPTPDPCSPAEVQQYVDAIDDVGRRFDDAVSLADSTPRMSLAPMIESMQAIRRDAEDLEVPECAESVRFALVLYMDRTINAFISFLGNDPDTVVNENFQSAVIAYDTYTRALERLATPEEEAN